MPERNVARLGHTDALAVRGRAARAHRALSAVVLTSHLESVCSFRCSATSSRSWKGGEVYHLTMNVLFSSNAYEDTHFDSFIQSGCSALRTARRSRRNVPLHYFVLIASDSHTDIK